MTARTWKPLQILEENVFHTKQRDKKKYYLVGESLIATTQCVVLGHAHDVEVRDAIQARLSHDERNNGKTGQQGIRHQLQEAAVRLGKLGQSGGVGFYGARSGYYLAQQERGAC